MNYIDTLLERINLEDEMIKEYCKIDNVEVDEISETWVFYFHFERTIPILHYRNFINHLNKIKDIIPSVKDVDYHIVFDAVDKEMVLDYYDYVIDIILDNNKRILPLKEYATDVDEDSIKIYVPQGAISATIFRNEIEAELKRMVFL